MPLLATAKTGQLTINSVLMHKAGAWNIPDLHELWLPSSYKGENDDVAGAAGKAPNSWYVDQSTYLLTIGISGEADVNGTPYANRIGGLAANLAYLYTNVFVPPTYPTVTRAASLTMPTGSGLSTRTANVQPFLEITDRTGPNVLGLVTLVVPAGRFA